MLALEIPKSRRDSRIPSDNVVVNLSFSVRIFSLLNLRQSFTDCNYSFVQLNCFLVKAEHHKAVLFDCRDSGPDFFDIMILTLVLASGICEDPAGKINLFKLIRVHSR